MAEAEENKKLDYWYLDNAVDNNQIKEINSICEKYHEIDFYDNPAEVVKN